MLELLLQLKETFFCVLHVFVETRTSSLQYFQTIPAYIPAIVVSYRVTQKLPQLYTANYATFPLQIRKITVQIGGNFWVTQYAQNHAT